jgi:cob(I)alamin adenosyltransferase
MIIATRARQFNKLTNTTTFRIPDGNEGAIGLEEARAEAKWIERAYLSLYNIHTELILDGDMVKK